MNDPIFIVGLPRSGSTLLLNIITMNPKIFGIGEMLFLNPQWRPDFRYFLSKRVGDLSNRENIRKMIDLIFSGKEIPGLSASFWQYTAKYYDNQELKESIYNRIIDSDKSLQSIFKTIIEEISRYCGFNRCCVKFPVFVNYIPSLLRWYPKSKIIHIVRDPRAMAISRATFPGKTRLGKSRQAYTNFFQRKIMIFFAVFQYIWTSKLHCKYNNIENYFLVRYEDLLADPEKIIKELCEFTEIDFVPQMLHPREGQVSSVTGKKSAELNKKAATHWKSSISSFEELAINLLTSKSMKRFGYDFKNHPSYLNL